MDEKTFADRADRSEAAGTVADASSGLDFRKSRPTTLPAVTLTILVICGAIWAYLNFAPEGLETVGSVLAPSVVQIWAGAWWALITSAFVHVDVWHVLFNMWWTKDFGRLLEPRFGALKFIGFIVAAAIVGSGWQLAISDQTGIGFSGVVYAFFGYMLAARHRDPAFAAFLNKNTIGWMLGWLVLCIVLTAQGIWNIANGAHVAGFLFGFFVARSMGAQRFVGPARIGVAVLAACSVVPIFYMPWSEAWPHRETYLKYEQAEKLALQGDPEGQYYYAHLLLGRAAEAERTNDTPRVKERSTAEVSQLEQEGSGMLKKSAEQGYLPAMNDLAWRLATDPRDKVRDGDSALKFAQLACEKDDWATAGYIDTLAAAHAELGQWEQAIAFQQQAIAKANAEERANGQMPERLQKYVARSPERGQ